MPSSSSFTIISKSTVYPDHKSSSVQTLRLSVSDLPMLACHYIQKGVLLTSPPPNHHYHHNHQHLISDLKASLSTALAYFPALAGRLTTDSSGHIHITCNDSGVEFVQASAKHLTLMHLISPEDDVHAGFKKFFTFDATLSYSGHTKPLAAVQVTELADGLFIGCTVNHAVVDGTSFWHFFNTFAEISKGCRKISHVPDFVRSTSPFDSSAVLKIPPGGPKATFADDEPLRERIFHFSKDAIADLKLRANSIVIHQKTPLEKKVNDEDLVKFSALENLLSNNGNDVAIAMQQQKADEISSFQSLSAQLWRSVTRARNLKPEKQTTFRMAVNCRSRLEPNLSSHYFGNAIQSIPTVAPAGELLANDLNWAADQLHKNVVAHDDSKIRWGVKDWESNPRLFPLGNFDGAMITMGSSPRFPMYNNDFGWGRPVAVRSGKANKFDGKISAFPGRDGGGSVDLEVCLAPETMAGLERDYEFMQYVSACNWLK